MYECERTEQNGSKPKRLLWASVVKRSWQNRTCAGKTPQTDYIIYEAEFGRCNAWMGPAKEKSNERQKRYL